MDNIEKIYCEDCKWERHTFSTKEWPKCSHLAHRMEINAYDRKRKEEKQYPFCCFINTLGECNFFSAKEPQSFNIFGNIINIFREWRK